MVVAKILNSRPQVYDELTLVGPVLNTIKCMSIALDNFCLIVFLANPAAVVLSTCIGVGGWGCPISSIDVHIGMASWSFI